jgi:hypothetical protein
MMNECWDMKREFGFLRFQIDEHLYPKIRQGAMRSIWESEVFQNREYSLDDKAIDHQPHFQFAVNENKSVIYFLIYSEMRRWQL